MDLPEFISDFEGKAQRKIFQDLGYTSFILSQYKLLYFETPKCACSTMKRLLWALSGSAFTPRQVRNESTLEMVVHDRRYHPLPSLDDVNSVEYWLTSPEITRFCIVRNPYSRLASAWSDKIRQKEPGYEWLWLDIDRFYKRESNTPQCPSFSEFVTWVVETNSPETCNIHWRPLTKYLDLEVIKVDSVLKTENLVTDFSKILAAVNYPDPIESSKLLLSKNRVNESLPTSWKELYTADIAQKVCEYYAEDFDVFGYDVNSWTENISSLGINSDNLFGKALDMIRKRNETIVQLLLREEARINDDSQLPVSEQLRLKAHSLAFNNSFESALSLLHASVIVDPSDFESYRDLALIYKKIGKSDLALENIKIAKSIYPCDSYINSIYDDMA